MKPPTPAEVRALNSTETAAIVARHLSTWHRDLIQRRGRQGVAVILDGQHGTGGGGLLTATRRDGIHGTASDGWYDGVPPTGGAFHAVAGAGVISWPMVIRFLSPVAAEPVGQLDLFAELVTA